MKPFSFTPLFYGGPAVFHQSRADAAPALSFKSLWGQRSGSETLPPSLSILISIANQIWPRGENPVGRFGALLFRRFGLVRAWPIDAQRAKLQTPVVLKMPPDAMP
jgi:hypothetical protein